MSEKALYFIAVIPPQSLCDSITEIKNDFVSRFNSKHSLKSPPHITLQMPFQYPESKEHSIVKVLSKIDVSDKSNIIHIDGFGQFNHRVIYLQIQTNDKLWNLWKRVTTLLHSELGINNSTYRNRGFHPHITVAFRDLKKSEFLRAWTEYETKEFKSNFNSKSLFLLKHDNTQWNIVSEV